MAGRDLGEVDDRIDRLDLAEEEGPLTGGVGPMLEELAGDRRDAAVAGGAEGVDVLAHVLGFAAGVLLGGVLSLTVDPRLVTRGQDRALLGGTLIALAAAWILALR